jgi:predicted unusual protein kinase regulating ubiquinone biosynthesis (AarF/ABC1/UbiB family)
MAEIVSAMLCTSFDRLASPVFMSFVLFEGVGEKMDKCRTMFRIIEPFLDDVDEKQHTKRAVKCWLDDLKDLAYDMDDILDEIVTEALQRKLTAENQASTSKVRHLIQVRLRSTGSWGLG